MQRGGEADGVGVDLEPAPCLARFLMHQLQTREAMVGMVQHPRILLLQGQGLGHAGYPVMVMPPSATSVCPVTKAPAREARNTAMPPISSGSPIRASGVLASVWASSCGLSQSARAKSVLIRP